jgi:putative serine protease PepD
LTDPSRLDGRPAEPPVSTMPGGEPPTNGIGVGGANGSSGQIYWAPSGPGPAGSVTPQPPAGGYGYSQRPDHVGQPVSSGAGYPPAGGNQPAGGPGSPWWSQAGARDPWRDPSAAPSWLAPTPPGPPPSNFSQASADGPPRRGGLGQVMLVSIVVAIVAGLLGGALGYVVAARTATGSFSLGKSSGDTPALAERAPTSVAGIAKQVQPSVVTVVIRSTSGNGNGSGFVISDKGYILTNNHVAAPAAAGGSLRVQFSDGSSAAATIVGRDASSDIAVLKISKAGLKTVKFGDSNKIAIGDPVVAFGSPLGLADTVTSGIVSAVDRPVCTGCTSGSGQGDESDAFLAAIQTDAAINPGNSGGPLVDGAGRVIGVNSAIAALPTQSGSSTSGNIGIGFAIPINQAKRIAEELIASGKARTTVIGAEVNLDDQSSTGAVLSKVVAGGPADKSGLHTGDIVTHFADRPIEDGVALIALIRKQPPGSKVGIEYRRSGRTTTTSVTLSER